VVGTCGRGRGLGRAGMGGGRDGTENAVCDGLSAGALTGTPGARVWSGTDDCRPPAVSVARLTRPSGCEGVAPLDPRRFVHLDDAR